MANKSLTIDMITLKALEILENQLVVTKNVNRQYDDSFGKTGAKIGSQLRIRLPDRVRARRGAKLQVEDRNEQFTTLRVENQVGCDVAFSSAELEMNIDDYADRILKPRMSQIAAEIDMDVAGCYRDLYNSVGTPGTTPSTSQVVLAAGQKLNEMAAPVYDRYMTINPAANAAIVEGFKGFYNPQGKVSQQFNSGMVASDMLGFGEIGMSQSIRTHLTGTRASTGATVSVASAQGDTILTLTGLGNAATVNRGDVFTIAGVFAINPQTRESTGSLAQFVATATVVASAGGTAQVPVSPAIYDATQSLGTVTILPPAGAAVVFMGGPNIAYPQNLFYNKDAITFATADLLLPQGTHMASRKVYEGISMRVVQAYDINNDIMPCRIDVLYGYGVIRPELGGRVWG